MRHWMREFTDAFPKVGTLDGNSSAVKHFKMSAL